MILAGVGDRTLHRDDRADRRPLGVVVILDGLGPDAAQMAGELLADQVVVILVGRWGPDIATARRSWWRRAMTSCDPRRPRGPDAASVNLPSPLSSSSCDPRRPRRPDAARPPVPGARLASPVVILVGLGGRTLLTQRTADGTLCVL